MKRICRLSVGAVLLLAPGSIWADQPPVDAVTLKTSSESFDKADGWSDGHVPESGKDYLVTDTRELRTRWNYTGSDAFKGGSLWLGNDTTSGKLVFMTTGNRTDHIPNLHLNNSIIANNVAVDGDQTCTVSGACTVHAIGEGKVNLVMGDNINVASGMRNVTLACSLAGVSDAVLTLTSCLSGIEHPTKLFLSPAAAAGASANVGMTVSGTNWISSM